MHKSSVSSIFRAPGWDGIFQQEEELANLGFVVAVGVGVDLSAHDGVALGKHRRCEGEKCEEHGEG